MEFNGVSGKVAKPKSIKWSDPNYITFEFEDGIKDYKILKSADTFLHKQLDIKPSTSKEVYKKSKAIWAELRDSQLSELNDSPDERKHFNIDDTDIAYIIDDSYLIDVYKLSKGENVSDLEDNINRFMLETTTRENTNKFFTTTKSDLVKLIYYSSSITDVSTEDYVPVVILEMSNSKANYIMYTGILMFNGFVFMPSSQIYLHQTSYADFVKNVDISTALEDATQEGQSLYDNYMYLKANPIEVSAREVISILKKVGYKLDLKDDNELAEIPNMSDEENNLKIQRFFNTFKMSTGETAYDILALSEFKKIFRYNKLTTLDILQILSKEYVTYDGGKITAELLNSVIYEWHSKKCDKNEIDALKAESNN